MGEQIKIIPRGGRFRGRYTNYFKVGFNAFEFVVDFGQFYPENESTVMHTRIITNPESAKKLIRVLQDSIAQYEQDYGVIKIITDNS